MSQRKTVDLRRVEFIEAAARVIAREGVERATTRRIAQEAGAPLAALHYCFHSKDELLEAVQEYLSRDFPTRLDPMPPGVLGLKQTIAAHARRVWSRIIEHPEEQVATFELLLRRYRQAKDEEDHQVKANEAMYQAWIESTSNIYLNAALEAGEMLPNNLDEVAQLFIAGIDGLSMLYVARPESINADALIETLIEAVTAACNFDNAGNSVVVAQAQ